jgi:hypothetical protein
MAAFLASWPGGSLESTLKLAGLLFLVYALVLWVSAVIWVYRDIRARTSDQMSQLVAVLLVAVFNLPGLMVYLVIRPQNASGSFDNTLEAEALLHELALEANSCQTCRRPVEDDYRVCPYCRTVLREPCRNCGQSIRTSWLTCPYCATDRVQQRQARQASTAIGPTETAPLEPPPRARRPRVTSRSETTPEA